MEDVRQLAAVAAAAGYPALVAELEDAENRARQGRFYVALIGQFKRGKSSLLNALVDADLLPTGVPPVTSVITLVRWGDEQGALVHYQKGPTREVPVAQALDLVTETGNPANHQRVRAVEVEWPAAILASGLCLVDTPGVGSVIEANARETHSFIPHLDVALAVLGADPPITAAELDLLRPVVRQGTPLLVAVNKADTMRPADLDAGLRFIRRILHEHLGIEPALLVVSARAARAGQPLPDGRPAGGVPELRARLEELARRQGAELASAALARTLERVHATLRHVLGLERRALTEPAQAAARRAAELEALSAQLGRFLFEFGYRLQGELDRFQAALEDRRAEFAHGIGQEAEVLARAALERLEVHGESLDQRRLRRAAWLLLEERLAAWDAELVPWVNDQLAEIAARFSAEAARLFAAVGDAVRQVLGEVAVPEPPVPPLRPAARYYFAPDPGALAIDLTGLAARLRRWLLPPARWRAGLVRQVAAELSQWGARNATRATSEIWLSVADARRAFEEAIGRAVRALSQTAEQALRHAELRRAAGEAAVAERLRRLDELMGQLEQSRRPGEGRPSDSVAGRWSG